MDPGKTDRSFSFGISCPCTFVEIRSDTPGRPIFFLFSTIKMLSIKGFIKRKFVKKLRCSVLTENKKKVKDLFLKSGN